jgi:hypothetical protein
MIFAVLSLNESGFYALLKACVFINIKYYHFPFIKQNIH